MESHVLPARKSALQASCVTPAGTFSSVHGLCALQLLRLEGSMPSECKA